MTVRLGKISFKNSIADPVPTKAKEGVKFFGRSPQIANQMPLHIHPAPEKKSKTKLSTSEPRHASDRGQVHTQARAWTMSVWKCSAWTRNPSHAPGDEMQYMIAEATHEGMN